MCFLASEPDRCTIVLPFRDIVKAEPMDPGEGSRAEDSFADVNGVFITTKSDKAEENSLIMGGIAKPHKFCSLIHSHRDEAMKSPMPPETPDPLPDIDEESESAPGTSSATGGRAEAAAPGGGSENRPLSAPPPGEIETEPLYHKFGIKCKVELEAEAKAERNSSAAASIAVTAVKEHMWELHFATYGRGVSMFRSQKVRGHVDIDLALLACPAHIGKELTVGGGWGDCC